MFILALKYVSGGFMNNVKFLLHTSLHFLGLVYTTHQTVI